MQTREARSDPGQDSADPSPNPQDLIRILPAAQAIGISEAQLLERIEGSGVPVYRIVRGGTSSPAISLDDLRRLQVDPARADDASSAREREQLAHRQQVDEERAARELAGSALEDALGQLAQREQELELARLEGVELGAELSEARAATTAASKQVENFAAERAKLKELESDLEQARVAGERASEWERQLALSEQRVEALERSVKAEQTSCQEGRAALKKQSQEAEQELTGVREEFARVEGQYEQQRAQAESHLNRELASLRERTTSLSEELTEERTEREGRERLQASLVSKEAQRGVELDRAQAELAEMGVQLAAGEREKSLLEGELRQAGRRIEAFEERVQAFQGKHAQASSERQVLLGRVSELEAEVKGMGEIEQSTRRYADRLESELKQTSQQLEATRGT